MLNDVEKIELLEAFQAVHAAREKFRMLAALILAETIISGQRTRLDGMLRDLERSEETAQLFVDKLT